MLYSSFDDFYVQVFKEFDRNGAKWALLRRWEFRGVDEGDVVDAFHDEMVWVEQQWERGRDVTVEAFKGETPSQVCAWFRWAANRRLVMIVSNRCRRVSAWHRYVARYGKYRLEEAGGGGWSEGWDGVCPGWLVRAIGSVYGDVLWRVAVCGDSELEYAVREQLSSIEVRRRYRAAKQVCRDLLWPGCQGSPGWVGVPEAVRERLRRLTAA